MVDLFAGPAMPPAQRPETWRRVRIGLSGLAGILLLLAAASTLNKRMNVDSPAEDLAKTGVKDATTASQPMAEMGVAPEAAPAQQPAQQPLAVPPAAPPFVAPPIAPAK
jgi:hypothetical protein